MTTAAELIHALQRRWRVTAYRVRPGEFPPGWQAWFEHMRARTGAVTGASAEAIVAVLLQRPLSVPPGRALALNRWQAFSTMWRQEWQPPAREERWVRALAATVSGLVHVAFALLVLWLGIAQFIVASAPPRGEETVVQVEYIGRGTPEEVGGGPLPEAEREPVEPEPVESTQAQPAQQPPAPVQTADEPAPAPRPPQLPELPVQPVVPPLQAPQPQVVQREIPEPQPVAEQPLAVSKPVPDRSSFTLPAPTIEPPEPVVATPSLQAPALRVETVPEPVPQPEFRPSLPQAEVAIERPSLSSDIPEVAVREVPTPLPQVQMPQLPRPTVAAPELQAEVPQVREVTIPTPAIPEPSEPASEPAVADAPTDTPVESTEPAATAPAETTASDVPEAAEPVAEAAHESSAPEPTEPAAEVPTPTAGAGPEPTPAPGGWPTSEASDDWGLAEREQPGRQAGQPPGLYDSDGSVNLAETPGSASPGLPPGTVTEEIADLDRAGTWLKRAPTDYEPTAFAKYWRPNESLLAEWVRKSVSTIRIPIPGTSKSIVCQTVLLAAGGSCWVQDPNLNNQPASARPPPDIPFKPELQEGNGSQPPH